MNLVTFLERLGLPADDPLAARLRAATSSDAPLPWRDLAAAVARTLVPLSRVAPAALWLWPRWDQAGPPLILGVAGGQGSGKSTLATQIGRALDAAGARVATCSLDDFYLSRARRRQLAAQVHPLLATRGVPGTHDVALLAHCMSALGGSGAVALPGFDKGADEPLPTSQWRRVEAPVDVLVLEGWCIGAEAQSAAALATPVNALEAEEDAQGVWRRYVNDVLAADYAPLWRALHGLVYLQVPDMAAVRRWRTQQEQALPAGRRMTAVALERFVAHYERLTLAMLDTVPARAQLVARLDGAHGVAAVTLNPPP